MFITKKKTNLNSSSSSLLKLVACSLYSYCICSSMRFSTRLLINNSNYLWSTASPGRRRPTERRRRQMCNHLSMDSWAPSAPPVHFFETREIRLADELHVDCRRRRFFFFRVMVARTYLPTEICSRHLLLCCCLQVEHMTV